MFPHFFIFFIFYIFGIYRKVMASDVRRNTLFIGDLSPDTTEDDLKNYFNQAMENNAISTLKICRDHNPPYASLRYGYLNFINSEDV
jgi:RNA recognition motif-containing protein